MNCKNRIELSECRFIIDAVTEAVENGKEELGNPFYQSKSKGKAIDLQERHSPDSDFESGIVKIQRSQEHLLDKNENVHGVDW